MRPPVISNLFSLVQLERRNRRHQSSPPVMSYFRRIWLVIMCKHDVIHETGNTRLIARFRQEQIEGLLLASCTENVVKFRHAIFDDDDDDDDMMMIIIIVININIKIMKYVTFSICEQTDAQKDRHTDTDRSASKPSGRQNIWCVLDIQQYWKYRCWSSSGMQIFDYQKTIYNTRLFWLLTDVVRIDCSNYYFVL